MIRQFADVLAAVIRGGETGDVAAGAEVLAEPDQQNGTGVDLAGQECGQGRLHLADGLAVEGVALAVERDRERQDTVFQGDEWCRV